MVFKLLLTYIKEFITICCCLLIRSLMMMMMTEMALEMSVSYRQLMWLIA